MSRPAASGSLTLRRVAPSDPAWSLVADYVATTDPVRDLLLWADVTSSIAHLSQIWLATEGEAVLGVAYAFALWPERPSLGLHGRSAEVERAMLHALVATGELVNGYVITEPAQSPVYEALGTADGRHREVQMTLSAKDWTPREIAGVRPGRLDELDAFYRAQGAGAWNPVQVGTGPYFVVERADQVVAAAGTHFAYEALAQVGNVFTDPAQRGHGHAERVTAAVVQALIARGHSTISLFVAADNVGARRIYERLGFRALRELDAFAWDAQL